MQNVNEITQQNENQTQTQQQSSHNSATVKKEKTWHDLDLTVHADLPKVIKKIVNWYNATSGGIVLAGDTGCGKTHIAKVICNAAGPAIKRLPDDLILSASSFDAEIYGAVFYDEPKFLEKIKQSYAASGNGDSEIIATCRDAQYLIIDDVGAAYVKDSSLEWYQEIFWRLIDARSTRNSATLFTTNLSPVELKNRLGKRAFSRLQALLDSKENYILMFDIPDYRARKW